jgi:hypothetical protein
MTSSASRRTPAPQFVTLRTQCPENGEDEESDPAEPSLGSVGDVHLDQTRWAAGGRRDLEQDPAESGIGDDDGLAEQLGSGDWQQGAMA